MTTKATAELHEGAKRIAHEFAWDEYAAADMPRAIIALAIAHAATETAALREALEALTADHGDGSVMDEFLSKHVNRRVYVEEMAALAPGAGARYAARVALLEAVADATRRARFNIEALNQLDGAARDTHQKVRDALAALDGEK